MIYWIYLIIAAIFEVGWPFGLKMADISVYKVGWISFSVLTMTLSGIFLFLAQRGILIGTAYAVWSGIGASCTFLIGILFFADTINIMRFLGIIMIVTGVVLLKLGH